MQGPDAHRTVEVTLHGYAFAWADHGLDLDSISDSVENVRLKVLSETMGWRFSHPDRYSQEEEWKRLLTYGKVASVLVSVVES